MHKYPKIPMTTFGAASGVLSREDSKKGNRAKFIGLYLEDINLSILAGKTYPFSLFPPVLSILCSYSFPNANSL